MIFQELFGIWFVLLLLVEIVFVCLAYFRSPPPPASPPVQRSLKRPRGGIILAWIVVLILFAVISLSGGSQVNSSPAAAVAHLISDTPYSTCLLYSFPLAKSYYVDGKVEDGKHALLPQEPPGCLGDLEGWLKKDVPEQVIVTGRADRRDLKPSSKYYSNESLAFERAQGVRAWLNSKVDNSRPKPGDRAILYASGPRYTGKTTDHPRLLDRDRSVDIRAYWQSPPDQNAASKASAKPPKTGFALNTQFLEPSVSVELLALMVALSAYLAVVRIFLGEASERLKTEAENLAIDAGYFEGLADRVQLDAQIGPPPPATQGKAKLKRARDLLTSKDKTSRQRDLLVFPDSLMIAAAFCLFLHAFFFLDATWLATSIRLFTLAVVTLLCFHGIEWFRSIIASQD